MNTLTSILRLHPYLTFLGVATCSLAGWRMARSIDSSSNDSIPPLASTHPFNMHEMRVSSRTTTALLWDDVMSHDPFLRTPTISHDDELPSIPMAKLPEEPASKALIPDLKLTGILRGKRSIAMINGYSLSVGMSIDGCTVREIYTESVLIEYMNQHFILSLQRAFDSGTANE